MKFKLLLLKANSDKVELQTRIIQSVALSRRFLVPSENVAVHTELSHYTVLTVQL